MPRSLPATIDVEISTLSWFFEGIPTHTQPPSSTASASSSPADAPRNRSDPLRIGADANVCRPATAEERARPAYSISIQEPRAVLGWALVSLRAFGWGAMATWRRRGAERKLRAWIHTVLNSSARCSSNCQVLEAIKDDQFNYQRLGTDRETRISILSMYAAL